MKTKTTLLLASFGIVGLVSMATAQITNIIMGTGFEGPALTNLIGNFDYGYTFAYAGSEQGVAAVPPTYYAVQSGAGVTNSSAAQVGVDYSGLSTDPNYVGATNYTYAGLADHLVFQAPMTNIVAGATISGALGSLTLSCDINVQGLAAGVAGLTNTDVTLQMLAFGTNGIPITNAVASFTGDVGLAGTNYIHFDIPLSSLGVNGGSAGVFTNAAILDAINCVELEYRVTGQIGTINATNTSLSTRQPVFGFTPNGMFNVDNVYLTQSLSNVVTPTQEKLIWQANWDNTFPTAGYGFHFSSDADNAVGTISTNLAGGVGGSASLEYSLDLSSWVPATSFSGFGIGARVEPIPYRLTSTNKSSYRIYVTAKAGGFTGSNTNVAAVAGIQFVVPDGTLSASNGQPDVVFELAPSITLTSNYQTFVFDGADCPIGIYNGGSQAMFDQYISQVDGIQVQIQPNGSPDIGTIFGTDNNNTIDIDNVKVVELVPATPPISVVQMNNQVEVFWTDPPTGGTAKLQSSTNVAGPYLDVSGAASGAASPYVVPPDGPRKFFRTQWVP